MPTEVGTLVIGAGPAGLAMAACLSKRDVPHVVVERGPGVGTSWRNHYHRLHLHTAKEHSSLPYMGFGSDVPRFPSREQVVAYLEQYAEHFGIEPRFGVDVSALRRDTNNWVAETSDEKLECDRVVLACGFNRAPVVPDFPGVATFAGRVVHSADYRTAEPFRGMRVLVVGAGNTGAELALDLLENGCKVSMCVRGPVHVVPREFLGAPIQVSGIYTSALPLAIRDRMTTMVSRMSYGNLASVGLRRPRIGPISQIVRQRKVFLIDIGTIERIKSGDITVYPGIERFDGSCVHFVDGRCPEFEAVVLATGYRSGLERWVEGVEEILDEQSYPEPTAGRTKIPGLYTVGFDNPPTGWLRQIGLDAPRVADEIVADIEASRRAS